MWKISLRHRRTRGGEGTVPCPPPHPLWPCNKVLKPNFQSIISQTNNDCSLLLLILAKLLVLDVGCENTFALSILVTALTACFFLIKKCAKMGVFKVKIAKIRWRLASLAARPPVVPPSFAKSWVRH